MRLILGLSIAIFATGCGASVGHFDKVTHYTADGIRAEADQLNGLIRTSKEEAKDDSKYFAYRDNEERQITQRNTKLTFWQRVAGAVKADKPDQVEE